MRRSFILLLALALALPAIAFAASGVPMMRALDKEEAKRGDTVIVSGENLGKANVNELYLTDGTNDVKLKIVEQTDSAITFVIGREVKFGRYSLMILTAGATPMFIEQPVKVSIVEQYTPRPPAEEAPAEPSTATPSESQ
ncbi:MAG: hypothetical protein IT169_03995 [Bryobacterales bacterium]|nr:hypothetical protein [Bryobacterales bacterium]